VKVDVIVTTKVTDLACYGVRVAV